MNESTTLKPQLVVGIDGSAEARGALDEGLRLAAALGYHVRVICAWTWPAGAGFTPAPMNWDPEADAKEIVANTMASLEIPEGVTVEAHALRGDAAELLIEASATARMLVTGSTGAGMARALFLGSVSTRVAQRAHCPVLVWRPLPQAAPQPSPAGDSAAAR